MEEPNSHDLPPGWNVEVKVRKNGKRDKYYFLPSSGLKFKSKVELFRYLDNAQNKVSIQKISPNVVVEKAIAEGLPPGWVKTTRIVTRGDTVRKDTYYIDPVSGYTFRSIEDVDRYLGSGGMGRNTLKLKDKDSSDTMQKDAKSPSASVTMKPTLSISMDQSSDLDMVEKDQQISRSACSEVYMHVPVSKCFTNKDNQEKKLQENSETKQGTENLQVQDHQYKNKHKKEINLPRRSSKRLAGIKVDPVPELQTRSRTRRLTLKQSGEEEESITNVDRTPNSLPDGLEKQKLSGKDKEWFTFSPLENNATVEECVRVTDNGDKVDAKLDYNLDFPLRELLTDPCIAFAVQTLTGVTFDIPKSSQTSSELKNFQHSEVRGGNGKKSNVGLGDNVFSSPENLAIPQQYAGDATKTNVKAKNEDAEPSEKSLDMSWMDPCIEFAIKTLTDSIPLDSDQNPKNCLQQQLSSSSNQQQSEMTMSSVSLDNMYQADFYCNQYFGTQKPMFNQSFVDPSLKHTRNDVGTAGARLPHRGENTRRNIC
ncbi:unnamed protein product [Sphenostylis stenocarpa]|uniref:MBD domain-containing protein n=1 Tax=Sphenostylis stenocarpa TaxID=92480 RepID=A0AA86T6J9_9FABA|nr:unnamed protein product [Sphenostylis stenocarpa]